MPQQLRVTVTRPTIRLALGSVPASVAGVGSINGMDGIVTLTAADVSAQPASADLTALAALSGTGYARRTGAATWTLDTPSSTPSGAAGGDLSGTYPNPGVGSVGGKTAAAVASAVDSIAGHIANTSNPHAVTAAQVNADPAGTASTAIATHVGLHDPHTQYALEADLGGAALLDVGTTAGTVAAGDDPRFEAGAGVATGSDWSARARALTVDPDALSRAPGLALASGVASVPSGGAGLWVVDEAAVPDVLEMEIQPDSMSAAGFIGFVVRAPANSWYFAGIYQGVSPSQAGNGAAGTLTWTGSAWSLAGLQLSSVTAWYTHPVGAVRMRWQVGAGSLEVYTGGAWLEIDTPTSILAVATGYGVAAIGDGLGALSARVAPSAGTILTGGEATGWALVAADAAGELARIEPPSSGLGVPALAVDGRRASLPVGEEGADLLALDTLAELRTEIGLPTAPVDGALLYGYWAYPASPVWVSLAPSSEGSVLVVSSGRPAWTNSDQRFVSYRARLSENWMVG